MQRCPPAGASFGCGKAARRAGLAGAGPARPAGPTYRGIFPVPGQRRPIRRVPESALELADSQPRRTTSPPRTGRRILAACPRKKAALRRASQGRRGTPASQPQRRILMSWVTRKDSSARTQPAGLDLGQCAAHGLPVHLLQGQGQQDDAQQKAQDLPQTLKVHSEYPPGPQMHRLEIHGKRKG